jgi:hypothetical protein
LSFALKLFLIHLAVSLELANTIVLHKWVYQTIHKIPNLNKQKSLTSAASREAAFTTATENAQRIVGLSQYRPFPLARQQAYTFSAVIFIIRATQPFHHDKMLNDSIIKYK